MIPDSTANRTTAVFDTIIVENDQLSKISIALQLSVHTIRTVFLP